MITDAPPLRDGTGKELHKLHDVVQQHLRALKALGYELSSPFVTAILELKLDTTAIFEWQKHSRDQTNVPDCQNLLDFLNLRAQATESSLHQLSKKLSKPENQAIR